LKLRVTVDGFDIEHRHESPSTSLKGGAVVVSYGLLATPFDAIHDPGSK
jgi:hypothetical protein